MMYWKKSKMGCLLSGPDLNNKSCCWYWINLGESCWNTGEQCHCYKVGKIRPSRIIRANYGYLNEHPYDIWKSDD